MCTRRHHRRVGMMSGHVSDKEFVARARNYCKMAINNTATGAWLASALLRLEQKENV